MAKKKAKKRIERFNEIIDRIENRCMAMDGPVGSTLNQANEDELSELWHILQGIQKDSEWIKSEDQKPEHNVSVMVFIPEEDNHCTVGMWDVSNKWVLLDEYRVPRSEVTYWRKMIDLPEDESFNPVRDTPDEDEMGKTSYQIRELQKKVFDLEKELREERGRDRGYAADGDL